MSSRWYRQTAKRRLLFVASEDLCINPTRDYHELAEAVVSELDSLFMTITRRIMN